ncbi:MAG: ferredoxin-type protein NapG [Epsilonproteobacteria bacterium]|nr:ferredoxin-type protein NapG [Campylobacterota bacterium]
MKHKVGRIVLSNHESKTKKSKVKISERRRFISLMAQSVGVTALGGLMWTGYLEEAKAAPLILRPPGAVPESDFLNMCIKCGQCAEACKNRDSNPDLTHQKSTLVMARPGDGMPIGTPFFKPQDIPCYMCEDIPCVPVCPTGALDEELVSVMNENNKELDINKARMGLAVVDEESCVAFWGIQCDACHRACPLLDEAITLEYRRNERTGKHAYLIPVVHSDICTGCGLCEYACITKKPAIYVLPHKIAQGEVGGHYIKGWDKKDEQRLQDVSTDTSTRTERSKLKPADYLNEGISYE